MPGLLVVGLAGFASNERKYIAIESVKRVNQRARRLDGLASAQQGTDRLQKGDDRRVIGVNRHLLTEGVDLASHALAALQAALPTGGDGDDRLFGHIAQQLAQVFRLDVESKTAAGARVALWQSGQRRLCHRRVIAG